MHPIAVGSGLRLFEDGGPTIPLTLISSHTFTTGVVHLVYGPDTTPPEGSYKTAREHLAQDS